MRITMPKAEDTHNFGLQLAEILRSGDLVILTGQLGAGKTALTKGIGAGLGVAGTITSPTFVIARTHKPGTLDLPLVHVDAYRLESLDELDDLDLDTDVATSVTCVEWGAGLAERLADAHLEVCLTRRSDDVREIELTGRGADWTQRLTTLAATFTHLTTPTESDSVRPDSKIGAAC